MDIYIEEYRTKDASLGYNIGEQKLVRGVAVNLNILHAIGEVAA